MNTRIQPLLLLVLGATALWAVLGTGPDAAEDDGTTATAARPPRPLADPARSAPAATAAAGADAWPGARPWVHPDSGRGLMGPAAAPVAAPVAPPATARSAPMAPPPPAPPAPAPAAAAARPAGLPLTLMGVVHTDTPEPQVFFTLGDQLVQARPGETIDGRFRIESITAAQVVVIVLPDQQRVVIPIAAFTATPGG